MKKIIFPVLLLTLVAGGLVGCAGGQNEMAGQVSIDYAVGNEFEVKIKEIKTDKQVYHSRENLVVLVVLESLGGTKDLLLEINGLVDGYGDYYINQRKNVTVSEADKTEYIETFPLPEYSTCSGLDGKHDIKVVVRQAGKEVAAEKTTFTLQP